jgi:uncharacterized damage-inducible protein DinB
MPIKDALIAEFDREMASTRRALDRIPDDKLGFQPHPKSWTMGGLITHIAQIPGWGTMTMAMDEFDLEPGGKKYEPPPSFTSTAGALAEFDKGVAECRAAMDRDDAHYFGEWKMSKNGDVKLAMPRAAVMRSFVMNHLYHHRGQLTVYLRLAGISVPEIYGPSADEGTFF